MSTYPKFDTRLPEPKKVKAKVRPVARKESSKAYNNKPPAVNTKLDNQKNRDGKRSKSRMIAQNISNHTLITFRRVVRKNSPSLPPIINLTRDDKQIHYYLGRKKAKWRSVPSQDCPHRHHSQIDRCRTLQKVIQVSVSIFPTLILLHLARLKE